MLYMRAQESTLGTFRRLKFCIIPAILFILILSFIWHPEFVRSIPPASRLAQTGETGGENQGKGLSQGTAQAAGGGPWEFSPERDELNFGLSDQQCQVRPISDRRRPRCRYPDVTLLC